MTTALQKAETASQRSYIAAKQSVSNAPVSELIAAGPSGLNSEVRPSLHQHRQQYRAFQGWPYVAISAIAKRVAGRQLFVGRVTQKPTISRRKSMEVKASLPDRLKAIGDSVEPLEDHALLQAMQAPNPVMVQWTLLYVSIASLELTGRAILWFRDNGETTEIWPLPSSWVEPDHEQGLFSRWKIQPEGMAEPFHVDGEDIVEIRLPDPGNPILGSLSPLQSQSKAVNVDDSIQTSQQQGYRNGIHPRHIVKIAKNDKTGVRPQLTKAQQNQIISALKRRYSTAVNSWEPFIADGRIESVQPLSNSPQEMDWINSGKQIKSRIMQAFGVNELIVGEVENGNRAQAVTAEQSFNSNVVNPLLDLISQVFTARVVPRFKSGNEKLVAWFERAEAKDPELEIKRWTTALKFGVVTKDEFRTHILNIAEMQSGGDEVVQPQGQASTDLDEAIEHLQDAVNGMKDYEFDPLADRLVSASKALVQSNGNGRH